MCGFSIILAWRLDVWVAWWLDGWARDSMFVYYFLEISSDHDIIMRFAVFLKCTSNFY